MRRVRFGGTDRGAAGRQAVNQGARRLHRNLFLRPARVNGVSVQPIPLQTGFPNVIHTQWGLSLWLESQRGNEPRTLMLDYGYSPNVLITPSPHSRRACHPTRTRAA
jgi:hypothetical protein